jgi:hypothetical protein
MTNKESFFASLHILMPAIPDGPADAGRRLSRYWYRESRCQVRTGWQKQNPFNLRNPRLMNYLCANKALFWSYFVAFCAFLWLKIHLIYAIRSTKVYVRKNKLYMENKANFPKVKLNVNNVLTKDYDKMDTWLAGKNKPNTNPIQSQSNPIKANKMPKQTQTNPNKPKLTVTYCLTRKVKFS